MTPDERRDALESIAAEVRVCTRCRLAQGRTQAVPGEGHPETEVVLIGEGPGFNEDQQGRPFVGAAGGLLTELLASIGWRRDEVFITNVVKCRPPGNRDPEPDEIAACAPYLRRQLEVLDPALVVTLGRFSLGTFMPGARISAAHGTVRHVDPDTGARDADAVALYHPAAAFRQAGLRETLFADTARLPEALLTSRERRQAHEAERAPDVESAPEPAEPIGIGAAPASQPIAVDPELPVAIAVAADPPAAVRVDPEPPAPVRVALDRAAVPIPAASPESDALPLPADALSEPIPDDQLRLF